MEPNLFESSPSPPEPQPDPLPPEPNRSTPDPESAHSEASTPTLEPSTPEPNGVTPDSESSTLEPNGVTPDSESSTLEPEGLAPDSESSTLEPEGLAPDSAPVTSNLATAAVASESPEPPTTGSNQQGQLWLPVLVLNLLVMGGVTVRVFSDPTVGNLRPYTFPETVELEGWTLAGSERIKPVEKPDYEGSSYRAGRHYRYRQGRDRLDVEIRYVTETRGGVDLFTREHERFTNKVEGEEIVAQIRQNPETGAFAEVTYDGYAYISTCMNPRGLSTVSPQQFHRNHELYDMVLGRVIPWLLGRERWRDDRCLWTLMYAPLGDDPEQTQAQLEAAWRDWFQTWEGQFPPR